MKHFTKVIFCSVITFLSASSAFGSVPVFSQKQINSLAATSFTLSVQIDQAGTSYYVVTTSAAPPSVAQVKAGQDNSGSAAFKSGSFPLAANTTANQNITGLASETVYFVYFIAENGGAEQTTVQTLSATTLDNTPPSFNSSSIQNNTTGSSFDLRVNVSEISQIYYVVTLSGTTPSATQVKAGQDNSGSAAFKSGNFSAPASTNTSGNITGLASGTLYHIYFIAEDAATPTPNRSGVQSLTATTPTVPSFNSSSITSIGFTQFDLTVNVDVGATIYFVVTQSATPPSTAQIKAGQNQTGGTPDASGNYLVTANTTNNHTINSLSGATFYHVYFVAENVLTSSVQTKTATTKDNVAPTLSSFTPVDGATNVATNTQLVMTFDKPVILSTSSFSGGSNEIHINGIIIARNSAGISIASNIVTVTIPSTLSLSTAYAVTIGDDVFSNVDGTDYGGISSGTTWNFTTNSGAAVTPVTASVCPNKFTVLNGIVLAEVAVDNFHGVAGASRTIILSLGPGFAFQPISTPVNIPFTAGRDISAAQITSATFNTVTVTVTFTGGNVSDQMDQITIQGLSVIYDGASSSPVNITKSGGTLNLDLQNPPGGNWATISGASGAGSVSATPTLVTTDLTYCQGENIAATTINATPVGGATFTWYSDSGLNTVVSSGTSANVNATTLGVSTATAASFPRFLTLTESGKCEGSALTANITVAPRPGADAGQDKTVANGTTEVCGGTSFGLGGAPTLQSPSVPGSYTFAWTSVPAVIIPSTPNPVLSIPNASTDTVAYQFTVTITDANSCVGTDVVNVDVKPALVGHLTQPTSLTFSPNGVAQELVADPLGGIFTGVGVTQTSDSVYKFAPSLAWDPGSPLPQMFNISYTVISGGCSFSGQVATMILSDQVFPTLSPEYCADEHPFYANLNQPTSKFVLSADASAYAQCLQYLDNWNNSSRWYSPPLNTYATWSPAGLYGPGARVRYINEAYVCLALNAGQVPDAASSPYWAVDNTLKAEFKGTIRNYYEGVYGGNIGSPTIQQQTYTYTGSGAHAAFNYYELMTNANYTSCPTCDYAYPFFYAEFKNVNDIDYLVTVPAWSNTATYYTGSLVSFGGVNYQQIMPYNGVNYTYGTQPNLYPAIWKSYGTGFDLGWRYKQGGKSGFYLTGQYVGINKLPTPTFTGLNGPVNPSEFCLVPTPALLKGSETGTGTFEMSYDGSTFGPHLGLTNGPGPFQGNFVPSTAFGGNPSGGVTKSFYIRYSVDPGTKGSTLQACMGSSSPQFVNVNSNPSVTISVPNHPAPYCYTDPPVNITTTSNSTSASTISFSGPGGIADAGDGTGKFSPGQAISALEVINFPVIYNYSNREINYPYINAFIVDANGCFGTAVKNLTVNPLPPAVLTSNPAFTPTPSGLALSLCYSGGIASLSGSNTKSFYDITYTSTPVPYTAHVGSLGSPVQNHNFDPIVYFNDAVSRGANHLNELGFDVVYTGYDNDNCTNILPAAKIKVAPQFPVTITGVKAIDEYCANESSKTITLSPYIGNGNLSITLDGVPQGIPSVTQVGQNGQFNFGLSVTDQLKTTSNGGTYVFEYDVQTGDGCHNPTSATVKVLPSPVAEFTAPPKCFGDLIPYNGIDNSGNAVGPPITPITYTWSFEGVDTLGQVSKHRFTGRGTYGVKLRIDYAPSSSDSVCTSQVAHDQVVGDLPTVDFDIANLCDGDATHFTGYTTNGVVLSAAAWKFDDGDTLAFSPTNATNIIAPVNTASHPNTTGKYGEPIHSYSIAKPYHVTFLARSQREYGSCLATKTRTATVLPYLTADPLNPYFMSQLNGGDGQWSVEDRRDSSTWEFAVPSNKSVIASTDKVWITNADSTYKSKDQSYVNSPCLDLSHFAKPSISINYRYNTDRNKDGATLQVSLDGGASWATLGNMTDGLNWYSAQNISATPGTPYNLNGFGWSGIDQADWQVGKHGLDIVVGKPGSNKARLRIAFASDAQDTLDGFAFNDIRIEERNRTALVENFTNSAASNFAANNTGFENIPIGEAVKIEYHTGYPGNDAINKTNPGDNDARAAFYGLSNDPNGTIVPRGYVDGFNQPTANNQADFTQNFLSNYLPLRSLVSSPLALKITNLPPTDSPENRQIVVQIDVRGLSTITTGKLKLYVGIVERNVGNMMYVMRKLLPDASGTPIPLPLLKDASLDPLVLAWEAKHISDAAELAVVAFVQDELTKDVLQSTFLSSLSYSPNITTGIEDILPELVSVFPNPADHQLVIELPQVLAHDVPIRLVDQIGHSVYTSDMKAGTYQKTIGVSEFSAGLYIVQVGSDKSSIVRKKILLVHEK